MFVACPEERAVRLLLVVKQLKMWIDLKQFLYLRLKSRHSYADVIISTYTFKAFYVTEHWLDLLISQSWFIMAQLPFIYILTKHPDGQEFDLYRR